MTLLEGAVIASGLAIGYWLVSVFTRPPPSDRRIDVPDEPAAGSDMASSSLPWHEVLGVSEWASDDEIAAAYREKIGQYHPDKVATMGPEIRALAELKAGEINEAYRAARRRT